MIRREEAGATWLIHQAAHAYIAGQIAQHWIGGGSLQLFPREELLIAAFAHDNGWVKAEASPSINRYGQPATFTEMPLEEHLAIWRDSIHLIFAQSRYAALLASLHCSALYDQRLRYVDDPPDHKARIHAFVDERRAWEAQLTQALKTHARYGPAVEPERLAHNLRLIQVWDYLSVLVCMGPVFEQTLEDVPLAEHDHAVIRLAPTGPRGLALDPYPLDGPLAVWIDARRIDGGPFESSAAYRSRLADAPYKPLMFEFEPFAGEEASPPPDIAQETR